jgi:riboflavin synthase
VDDVSRRIPHYNLSMFTGLVRAVGRLAERRKRDDGLELVIESSAIASDLEVGASVAVSGVCLTATEHDETSFHVDVARETLRLTKLGGLAGGAAVNLELPLRADDRLGGHFVQGHVDEVGRVSEAGRRGEDWVVRVEHAPESSLYVVKKGSIAVDGVSLTVTGCGRGFFEVMLIPHTLAITTLGRLAPRDEVNLEYDILAKYMVRIAESYRGLAMDESEESSCP